MRGRNGLRVGLLVAVNLAGVAAFVWPFFVPAVVGARATHRGDAPWIMLFLLGALGTLLFVQLGRGGMGPKSVALIGVLGAMMVALRLPGFVAGASAMFIVVLVAGNAFGPAFGFVLGAIGTLASGLFVGGIGPWLPFQMAAVGWVGMGAGLMPKTPSWPLRITALAAYGFVVGYVFGAIMNLWFWPFAAGSSSLGWAPELGAAANLRRYAGWYVVTSFGWDSFRAVGNAALVAILGRPLLASLDRVARRMNLSLEQPSTSRRSSIERAGARDGAVAHN